MRHLDLCSGIGGFALAARWMGWETVGFAEIDPFASAVLSKHWPGVPNYGDIATIPDGIGADIITAGFPCQPYSVAGQRLGAEDDRAIWPLVIEVVRRVNVVEGSLNPAWVEILMGYPQGWTDLSEADLISGTATGSEESPESQPESTNAQPA